MGGAGICEYDADGYIGCKVPHCQGAGEHPHLSTVRWDGEMRTLVLVLSKVHAWAGRERENEATG